MTQMGGTGIWCRICPQGACNYINAPNKYHFIRTANQITFLQPDVNCKGQMLSQPLDRTGCIESYDIFFWSRDIKLYNFFFFPPLSIYEREISSSWCVWTHKLHLCEQSFLNKQAAFLGERCVHEDEIVDVVLQASYSGDPAPVVLNMLKLLELQECRAGFQTCGLNFGFWMQLALRIVFVGSAIVQLIGWLDPALRYRSNRTI